jgi:O-methyltransferase
MKMQYYLERAIKIMPGLLNRISRRAVFAFDMISSFRQRESYVYSDGDFVRNSTLELVAQEIQANNVQGAVAELGVFRGEFAKLINRAFPDRKLYLFDTFEGFYSENVSVDKSKQYSADLNDFTNTSVELVMRKMRFPENCIVRKGYFPNSFTGIDEKYAFVSIDCDLYKPMYEGLNRFWEFMSDGGYIFIHDYQNEIYSGAKAAVRQFCTEQGITLVPMSDAWGTAIIAKVRLQT